MVESGIHAVVCDASSFAVLLSTNRDGTSLKDRRSQRRREPNARGRTVDLNDGSRSWIVWGCSWTILGAASILSVTTLALRSASA